jgi:hypothetical protein
MNLPFTPEQFLSVFAQYNQAVWPLQIVLNLLGLAAIILAIKKNAFSNRLIVAILAFLWLWIGIVYHLAFFAAINPGAYVFAALNVIQGIVFLAFGAFTRRLSFHFKLNLYGIVGALLILYATVIYPLLGYAFGHIYPKAPTFGLPCPTTIFTFGLLLWTDIRIPKSVLIIPFLWSLIGFSAALTLGILEDTGLLVAGIVGVTLIVLRDRNALQPEPEIGTQTSKPS